MERSSRIGKKYFSGLVALAILDLLVVWLVLAGAAWGGASAAWFRRYNGPGNDVDFASAIAVDTLGNVYVTGHSASFSSLDYATIKYSSSGERLWVRRYNGTGDSFDKAHAIAVDGSGNVYVTGESWGAHGGYDYATIKYSSSGERLWVRRYDGPVSGSDYGRAIAVDTGGNVYVTGESYGGPINGYDYATVKYSSSGERLWVKRYNASNGTDDATAIAVRSGNVYVTGGSVGATSNYDYATFKYSTSGVRAWFRRYNGPGDEVDYARAIAVDSAGNVYVTGESDSFGSTDYATIKYSSSGERLWVRRYNGPGDSFDKSKGVAVDSAGNVYVIGESWGAGTGYDYATIKYSPSGERLWVRRYDGPVSGSDYGRAIAVDTEDNVYVTGMSFGGPTNGYDYATVKYSPSGERLWVKRYDFNNGTDDASAIAVRGSNVYVTGGSFGATSDYDYATIKYTQTP
jgi:uncharacterized delta-60 repeat protein